jgi:hypothetical protein
MKVDCITCGYEINLDHKIFDDYSGPIKCFSCGAMMEVKTEQGVMCSSMPLKSCGLQIAEERNDAAAL